MYYDEDQTPPPRRYEDRYENLDDRDSPDVHRRASEDRPERDRRTEAGIERRPQEVPLERTNLSQSDKSALPLDDPSEDVWADATPVAEPAYQPQELKLPQKQKQPEYEET
jgi:hypothetical protein